MTFLRLLLWLEKRQPGTLTSALRQSQEPYDQRLWRLACFVIYEHDLNRAGWCVGRWPRLTVARYGAEP